MGPADHRTLDASASWTCAPWWDDRRDDQKHQQLYRARFHHAVLHGLHRHRRQDDRQIRRRQERQLRRRRVHHDQQVHHRDHPRVRHGRRNRHRVLHQERRWDEKKDEEASMLVMRQCEQQVVAVLEHHAK